MDTFTNTQRHENIIAGQNVPALGQIKLSKEQQKKRDIAARIEDGSLMEVPSNQTEESDAKTKSAASKTTDKEGGSDA